MVRSLIHVRLGIPFLLKGEMVLLGYFGFVSASFLRVGVKCPWHLLGVTKKSFCKETKQRDKNCHSRDLHPSLISLWIPLA